MSIQPRRLAGRPEMKVGGTMGVFGFFTRRRFERIGFELYSPVVRAARERMLFQDLRVPDTLDGRFDMIGVYAALLIRRLRGIAPHGPAAAQAVFDAMFSDMDVNLREIGVGDLSVGKRVRAMWEAFHGRALAYDGPLARSDADALADALVRNVWRGEPAGDAGRWLATILLAQRDYLAAHSDEDLMAGRVRFLDPAGILQVSAIP